MRFRTDYGPIIISEEIGKEYEKKTGLPLSSSDVNMAVSLLSSKDRKTQSKVEERVLALAKAIHDGDAEVETLIKDGRFTAKPYGSLHIDKNGKLYQT